MTCTTATLPAELQGVSYVIRGDKSYELSNHLGKPLNIAASDRSRKPGATRLREMPGAEADRGRPRKPAFPLAALRGLDAKGAVPPV
jgi:hypothetical protein